MLLGPRNFVSVYPAEYAQTQNVGDHRDTVDDAEGRDLAFYGFHADDKYCGHVEMEIPAEKDQPYSLEGKVPEAVLPYEKIAHVQQALHEYAENRIAYGPEPFFRNAQNPQFSALGKGVVENDSRYGEHEHDLYVPANHGAKSRLAGSGPEGRALGKMKHPTVPGLVEKIHAEHRKPGKNGVPVARGPGLPDLVRIDIEDYGQQGNNIPLQGVKIPQALEGPLRCRCNHAVPPLSGRRRA